MITKTQMDLALYLDSHQNQIGHICTIFQFGANGFSKSCVIQVTSKQTNKQEDGGVNMSPSVEVITIL